MIFDSEYCDWSRKLSTFDKRLLNKKGTGENIRKLILTSNFSYEDIAWVKPVSDDIRKEIEKCFQDNPKHKQKFDAAEIKLQPMITNCWLDLPEEQESEFIATIQKLPAQYTMDEFWKAAKDYKKYVSNPPTKYLLNLLTYPWDMDKKANLIYSDWELTKN